MQLLTITFNNAICLAIGFLAGIVLSIAYAGYKWYLADKRFQSVIKHIDAKYEKQKVDYENNFEKSL